jgi:hypothetical protein
VTLINIDSADRVRSSNSSLLSDETSTALMMCFEGGRFVEGAYVPLRNDKVKDAQSKAACPPLSLQMTLICGNA